MCLIWHVASEKTLNLNYIGVSISGLTLLGRPTKLAKLTSDFIILTTSEAEVGGMVVNSWKIKITLFLLVSF